MGQYPQKSTMLPFDRTHPVSRETNVWDYLPYPTEFFSPLLPASARRAYADVITKFSGIDRFPFFLRYGNPLRMRTLRWKLLRQLSAIMGKILSQFASKIYRICIVSEENEQFKSAPCHLKLTTLWCDRPPPPRVCFQSQIPPSFCCKILNPSLK